MLQRTRYDCYASLCMAIGHVHNIPIMQFPKILNQKLITLTENSWEFQNNAVQDTL